MRLDRLRTEIENVPTGGPSYREAVERFRTLRRVDEGDAVEALCARLAARGVVVRESSLAARTAGFRDGFRRGGGCWR